jgi:hypothetical protein
MNRMKRKILATLPKPRPETKTEQIARLYPHVAQRAPASPHPDKRGAVMGINGHDLARLERESICEACGNKTHETGRDVEGTWMCATCADMTEYGEVGQ